MRPDNYREFRIRQLWRKLTRSKKQDFLTFIPWFTGEPMHDVMATIDQHAPFNRLHPSNRPLPFPLGPEYELGETFTWKGSARRIQTFLDSTDTSALLVLKDGHLVHESYFLNGGVSVPWLSMSVAKSFVSALVGCALEDGLLESIDEPISKYVKVAPGSAYDEMPIKAALQMSSGARWTEDYSDPASDVFRVGRAMSGASGGFDGFISTMSTDLPPDTVCRYNSGETQVLGALVRALTGEPLARYMQRKLCEPLGFEHPGFWATDTYGVEMAYGGLNLVARDYAKLGECYRRGGLNVLGERVIPQGWVEASTRCDSPVRKPGRIGSDGQRVELGYGYQWWIPESSEHEFMAIGVLNQYIYVNPARGVTVVKLSANRMYGTRMTEEANRGEEHLAFLRSVSANLAG